MSDKMNDNSEQNTSNNMDKETGKNNSNSQSKVDLSSMMQLASTLLKNDVIMNSVTEQLSKNKPIAGTQSSKVTEKSENVQMSTLYKKVVDTANDVSELKEEYKGLASLSDKIEKLTVEISELTKVLKTVVEHQINPGTDKK